MQTKKKQPATSSDQKMNAVKRPLKSRSVKTHSGMKEKLHFSMISEMKRKRLFDVSPVFKPSQVEVIQIINKKNLYKRADFKQLHVAEHEVYQKACIHSL